MITARGLKSNIDKIGRIRLKKLSGVSAGAILFVILITLFIISFALGRYPISPLDVIKIITSQFLPIDHSWKPVLESIVINMRLPRILAAMLVGACLSLAGASFQGLFRNPLVSPDILGVSAGAGCGAALAILLDLDMWGIQILAFCFGITAVGISYFISRVVKGNHVLSLILAGMAIGALFNSVLSIIKLLADPINQLHSITFWLMGGLEDINMKNLYFSAVPMLIGMTTLVLIRWKFNVLAMGEEEAKALGVNTTLMRFIIVICCTLISASSVCIAGTIGWVGLVIPHVGRILVGPDHKKLMPVCVLLGAVYLLFIDNLARTVFALEIPIGILTAIIGAPFFIYLLNRANTGWA
jgi:iron complex transport system permease protein